MSLERLDISADVGEGFGNWTIGRDDELLPLLTTISVACGFHASDPMIMERTVALSKAHGIALGAHPGLPDLMGFGRRRMAITPDEMHAYILYQVGALEMVGRVAGVPLHHVKPHGAMYWMINEEKAIAEAALAAIAECQPGGMFYWPAPIPDLVQTAAQSAGLQVVGEFYIDLRYDDQARLIHERKKSAIDIPSAVRRARTFVFEGWIEALSGTKLRFDAASLCIHGDGPNAVEVAQAVRDALGKDGIQFTACEAHTPTEAKRPRENSPIQAGREVR